MPATVPDDVAQAIKSGGPAPAGLSGAELTAYAAALVRTSPGLLV
jgi:hypothetical protein